MAIRRHVLAARNTTPDALARALQGVNVSEVEAVNGWCWVMASVWTTGSEELLRAAETLEGPSFLVTTEDGCRWWLHLRKRGMAPVDTIHEFGWIRIEREPVEGADDWNDLYEEEDGTAPEICSVEIPGFPPLPARRLAPLDISDELFEPYIDDDEDEDEAEGPGSSTPLEELVDAFESAGVALPPDLLEALADAGPEDLWPRFLSLHAEHIAGELERFGVPHDHQEVVRILTGQGVTPLELDGDVGNLWRFLVHLGLGPRFEEAIRPPEEPEDEPPAEDPGLRIVRAAGKLPLIPVEGGPAPVALEEAPLLARLTCCQTPHPQFTARIDIDQPVAWPSARVPDWATLAPAKKGFGFNLTVESLDALNVPRARRRLGALLAELPEGARLEWLGRGEIAKTRLAGVVREGQWWIESASGPLSAEDIGWMLEVFRATEARKPHTLRDEGEADALMARASEQLALCDDPPRREGVRLGCDGRREAEALGALILRHRLGQRWDFTKIEARDARNYKDWRKFEADMARENALPVTEVVVFEGVASRFLEADYKARSIDASMREKTRAHRQVDRDMAALGYQCLGAVVCEAVGGGILRCYAHPAERTWSVSYALPYGMAWHDYTTVFDDGTVLTTGNGLMEGSIRSLRMLERACPGTSIGELHTAHREGLARLEGRGLLPVEIDPTLEGICRAMDESLARRLGGRVEVNQ